MIGQLRGQLIHKKPNALLLDVQGVGYEVFIPLTSFYELPGEGNEVTLKIHTHVREDALTLFGFLSQREKDLFLKLLSISGIGPKLAIAILSGAQVEELAQAIVSGNLARLTAIPGVGRKTAERVVLELKGQMTPFLLAEQVEPSKGTGVSTALEEDILSALTNLGYPRASAEKALSMVLRSAECERTFEDVLRNTLRRLAG
ncbi:MAG TPA: Holliday junction branch migration protein RuvA [Acidobacteriota bacterium]|nr:Holliday junction branch migration protein RuvA [Acidobacteriota bacterium]